MNKNPGRRQRRWAARQAKRKDGKVPNLPIPVIPTSPGMAKRRITTQEKQPER